MKGHVVFPAPSLKELEEDIKAEMRTGWNPDAQEKVKVRTVLDWKSFEILRVAGYNKLEYWLNGQKVVTLSDYTVDLGATYETVPVGKHFIYIDNTGIHATQTPWDLARKDIVFAGIVYWNSGSLYTGWHCHNWVYPADMRAAARPQITSGLGVTINSIEDHKIDVSDGILKFADIDANIRGNVTSHETFKQQLRVLEARRLWKVGGLWYDDLESELVAKLDGSNNVRYCDPAAGLQSLTDGEYTAVWLVATFCNHRPVKIVLGSFKGATAEEAKTLNTPESYNDLAFRDCADVSHPISRIIVKDIAVEPWYELIEIDDTIRDDDAFNPLTEKGDPGEDGREVELSVSGGYIVWRYVGETVWNNLISLASITGPAGADGSDGLPGADGAPGADGTDGKQIELSVESSYIVWRYVGDTSWINLVALSTLTGPAGADGTDGTSMYTYVAYATDNSGTGFSLTPTDLLKYRAEIHVTSPLTPPTSTDFSGATWVKYIGDDGEDGGGGGGTVAPELHLDFAEAGLEFIYNVPYSMKFTSQVSEAGDATLSTPLNTTMARYTKLTVTSTAAGLVSLYGEYV